jgi:hypothetical protein
MLECVMALVREGLGDTQVLCIFRKVHPDVSQQRFASLLHSRMCMHEREVDVDMVDGGGPLQCWACSRGDLQKRCGSRRVFSLPAYRHGPGPGAPRRAAHVLSAVVINANLRRLGWIH